MRILEKIVAYTLVVFGVIDLAVALVLMSSLSYASVSFAGTRVIWVLLGLFNLARLAAHTRSVTRLCLAANLLGLAFAGVYLAAAATLGGMLVLPLVAVATLGSVLPGSAGSREGTATAQGRP
jgi:hypothetical protein